jgi:glycosyltransferase involved in cell wall biosynthesis
VRVAYVVADRGIPVFGAKGASIHVREIVGALTGLGHQVTLVAAEHGDQSGALAANLVAIETCDGPEFAAALQADAAVRRRLREDLAMAVGEAAQATLRRLHAKVGFDLVYERYSLFSTAGVRTGRSLDVPCLVEVNAPLVLEQQQFRKLIHLEKACAVEAEVFEQADGLLTVSEEMRAYVLSRGARPDRTHVIPNAVDVARFHPGVAANLPDGLAGKFIVGFSGGLKPWHGIEVLMDAFRLLAARSTDFHLLVVGDGPLREWVRGYLRGAKLERAATMMGRVPNEELPSLLRAMHVAVAPYPAMEGFYFSPLKLYEYMAVGAPVVASRLGQIAEAIQHGETGLLVAPGNAATLAHEIERLRAAPALRMSLGAEAARKAAGRTWTHNAERVIELAQALRPPELAPRSA